MRNKESQSSFNEDDLSKQERNIRYLILEGKSNKEIANELFISLSTVKSHISNIYSKLRVSDRRELLQKYRN
ncbi:response regulator transcription factor [Maribacter sp. 4G9]|uniref:response regulator transcription factor n=1 Tax=Maribacter sp. 4G9 TaxID=1889777 RepID=UPI000C160351|nr:LuxR C-terminal-related transcriptional regulator [Maribacter sp. 4G9]